MSGVQIILVDGTSGIAPGSVEGAGIVTGICSKGEPGKAYIIGKDSKIDQTLGIGPLADSVNDVIKSGGQKPVVIAVPVEPISGGESEITTPNQIIVTAPDGTKGTLDVYLDGLEPLVVFPLSGTSIKSSKIYMHFTKGGGPSQVSGDSGDSVSGDDGDDVVDAVSNRNVAIYRLTFNECLTWTEPKTVPEDGIVQIGDTGISAIIPETPLIVDDSWYEINTTAAEQSIVEVMNSIEDVLERYDVEFVYIVGKSNKIDWRVMGAKADELWNKHRPTFFIAETRLPDTENNEDIDGWCDAMLTEKLGFAHPFVCACAAFGNTTDNYGNIVSRNMAGFLAGRIISIPVQRAIGRTRDGGITSIELPESFTSVHQQTLEDAGYITAKRYANLQSVYWGADKTLAEITSDYQFVRVLRVIFKAVRLARIQALKSIYDEAGDPLQEGGAAGLNFLKSNIENALGTMTSSVPVEMAGFDVSIPDGQDIVNNGVAVNMKLIGIPVIKEIVIYASYYYAGSTFDPRIS